MKFFRKHNKKLLAIFMAFLMIVFVGGSALESLFSIDPGKTAGFDSDLGPITGNDVGRANLTTSILEGMFQNWREPFGALNTSDKIEQIDWVLLQREARRLGFAPNVELARSRWSGPEADEFVNRVAYSRRIKSAAVYQALAEFEMLRSSSIAVAWAAAPSEAEIRIAARAALDKVKIRGVSLSARAFLDTEAEFTEAELQEHFSEYRDSQPGRGLDFGYLISPSIKLQYAKISRDVIGDAIQARADGAPALAMLLEKSARKYFDENRETDPKFRNSESSGTENQESEQPKYLEWDEAKQIAIERTRTRQADDIAGRIGGWLVMQAGVPWLGAPRDTETRYRTLPDGVDAPDYFADLLKNIDDRKLDYAEALSVSQTDFFPRDKAWDVPDIGKARGVTSGVGRPPDLQSLAFQCQGITPIPDKATPSDYLALFQTCRTILKDSAGNVYVFRVIATREAHPAESLDEVRDSVVEDLRLLRAYETAGQHARRLMQATRSSATGNIKDALDADEELAAVMEAGGGVSVKFFEPDPFARVRPEQASMARSKPGAYVAGPGWLPGETVEEIFSLEQASDPIAIIEMKQDPKLLVVQWLETTSGREDEFQELRTQISTRMGSARASEALTRWLDPVQIRARSACVQVEP